MLTVDRSVVVRTWSRWLEAATGMGAADVQGRPLADVIPDLESRNLLERFHRVLASGEAQVLAPAFHHYLVPCPPRAPSPHFTRMQQRVTLGPLREGTAIVGVMAAIEDVTARLDIERRLAAELRSPDPVVRQRASDELAAASSLFTPRVFTDVLRDGDWQVRRTAVEGMRRHASTDLLASLFSALRDDNHDFNVLSSALQLLSMIDVDVTAPLADLLKHRDPDVRIQAALALGDHPGTATAAALVEALADPDVNVRFHAIEALGRLRAAEGAAPLAAVAESRDFFLAFAAIDALVRIADPRVAERLLPLLEEESLTVAVVEALGSLGGGEVVAPLVRVLDRADAPTASIARAIATLYATYEAQYGGGAYITAEFQRALTPAAARQIVDALSVGTKDELRYLVLLLGWVQGPAIERALTQLLGRRDLRGDVIEALVRHGASVVPILTEQLSAEEEDVRLAAVSALGRLGDPRATLPLCDVLDDRVLTVPVAGALARIGDHRAFEPLLELLGDSDAAVRQAAVGALNSLGHPEMPGRVQALLGSKDAATRESAVRIAGYFGYAECADALFRACHDPEESVRRAALENAPVLDEGRALPLLLHAMSADTPRSRASAATALGRTGGDAARTALHRALTDGDPWVRYFAARALGQHKHPDSLGPLGTVAATDPAPHVRLVALAAIGGIDGPGTAELLATSIEDPDPEVAVAALNALGHVKHPAAVAALRHALREADPLRRAAAARALADLDLPGSVDALGWTAGAEMDDAVRAAALEGLGRLAAGGAEAGPEAVDALVAFTGDSARRETAIAMLARASARHLDRVAAALKHPSPAVRRSIVDVFTRSRHSEAAGHLRAALDDDDGGVREAAISALDRVGARGLLSRFATMAVDDVDAGVRRAAGAVLAREPRWNGKPGA